MIFTTFLLFCFTQAQGDSSCEVWCWNYWSDTDSAQLLARGERLQQGRGKLLLLPLSGAMCCSSAWTDSMSAHRLWPRSPADLWGNTSRLLLLGLHSSVGVPTVLHATQTEICLRSVSSYYSSGSHRSVQHIAGSIQWVKYMTLTELIIYKICFGKDGYQHPIMLADGNWENNEASVKCIFMFYSTECYFHYTPTFKPSTE